MNRRLTAFLGLLAATALTLPTAIAAVQATAAPGPAAAPQGHDVRRVIATNFPDPGFLMSGGRYYLYSTGKGFRVSHSTSSMTGYSRPKASMSTPPAWFGRRADGKAHLWAPHVFPVPKQKDGTRFVMYFTASKKGGTDCIGVARAKTAVGNFKATRRPLLCGPRGTTVIDPSEFHTSAARYLIYKQRNLRSESYLIKRVRVSSVGLTVPAGATPRVLVNGGTKIIEAPDLVAHGGRLWLFTSRRDFGTCQYYTQVFSAPSINGPFRSTNDPFPIRNRNGGTLCGTGGAEVIKDGSGWRMSFHVWDKGRPGTIRTTWVGRLKWRASTGKPYLARP